MAFLLLTSCSEKQKAQSIVSDFMADNIKADYSVNQYLRINRTSNITDDIINSLHKQASTNPYFVKDIKYATRQKNDTLVYLQTITVMNDKDTLRQTYYLTKDLKGVVAFK